MKHLRCAQNETKRSAAFSQACLVPTCMPGANLRVRSAHAPPIPDMKHRAHLALKRRTRLLALKHRGHEADDGVHHSRGGKQDAIEPRGLMMK